MTNNFIKVATRAELPPGGKKLADVDGRAIAVFHCEGGYYAIDDVCTHDGGPLADGELMGCEIQCPRHGARFDVRTGRRCRCRPSSRWRAIPSRCAATISTWRSTTDAAAGGRRPGASRGPTNDDRGPSP